MKRDFVKSVDRICEAVAKDNLLSAGDLRLVAVTGEMCLFSVTESRKVLGTFRIPIRQVSTSRVAGLLRETLAGAVPNTATHALTGGGADLGEEDKKPSERCGNYHVADYRCQRRSAKGQNFCKKCLKKMPHLVKEEETDEGLATTTALDQDNDVGQIDQKWVRTKYLAQVKEAMVEIPLAPAIVQFKKDYQLLLRNINNVDTASNRKTLADGINMFGKHMAGMFFDEHSHGSPLVQAQVALLHDQPVKSLDSALRSPSWALFIILNKIAAALREKDSGGFIQWDVRRAAFDDEDDYRWAKELKVQNQKKLLKQLKDKAYREGLKVIKAAEAVEKYVKDAKLRIEKGVTHDMSGLKVVNFGYGKLNLTGLKRMAAAIKIVKSKVQARLPWLWKFMPYIEIRKLSDTRDGDYTLNAHMIRINNYWGNKPDRLAWVLVHEACHHMWRTGAISAAAKQKWYLVFKGKDKDATLTSEYSGKNQEEAFCEMISKMVLEGRGKVPVAGLRLLRHMLGGKLKEATRVWGDDDEDVELTKDNIKNGLKIIPNSAQRSNRMMQVHRVGRKWTLVDPKTISQYVSLDYRAIPFPSSDYHRWLLLESEADEPPEVPNIRLFVYDAELTDPIIRTELFGEDIPFEIAQMDDFVLANHISPAGEPTLTIHMNKGSKVVGLILTLTKDQINVADHHMDKYARIIYPVAGKQVFVYFMRQEMAPAAPPPVVESYEASISATFEPRQTLVFEAKDKTEQMGSEQGFDGGTSEPATTNPMGGGTTARSENLAGSDGEYRMGVTPPGDLNKATGIPFSSGTVRESTEETSHLCKAIFLAGGPGSGKTTAADMMFNLQLRKDQLPTYAAGVRIVNPDDMLELMAKRPDLQKSFADLKDIPARVYELKPADVGGDMDSREVQNTLRPVTKELMQKLAKGFFTLRQPVVIDGTGRHYATISKQKAYLKSLGYDCFMVYVHADLDVAIKRNRNRARSVPDDVVRKAHEELVANREKYRRLFGNNYEEVVSGQTSYEQLRSIGQKILGAPLKNRNGKEWLTIHSLVQQQVEEAILESLWEGRDYAKEYKDYHGSPKQKANRNNRNKARRKMELETGDDREVDHGKPLSLGGTNHKNNLHVVTFAKNRAKGAKYENAQKGHAVWWTTDKMQTPPGDPTKNEILMGRVDKIEGPRAHVVGIMSGKDMGWHKISDLNCPSSVSETHDANDEIVPGTMGTKDYTAAVAVILNDGDVLLGLAKTDDDRNGKWCFPGGGIDPQDGGDPLLAARREAFEEAGVHIIPHSILDHPDKPGVAFVVSTFSSGQPEPNEEFKELQWVPIDAAREDFPDVYPENRHILWRLSPGLKH